MVKILYNDKIVKKQYTNGNVINKIPFEVEGEGSRLPSGYTEVEYIRQPASYLRQNTGAWTIPITNMVSGDSFTIIFSMDSTNQYNTSKYISIFGSDEVFAIRQDSGYGYNLNTKYFTNANTARGNYTMEYDTKLRFNYKPSLITVTNVATGVWTTVNLNQSSGYNPSGNLGVFGYWYGGTNEYLMMGNVYEIKIEGSDDTLKYDYIPCKRDSDNKVGLYDIVNDVFTSPSSFNITAGQEVTPQPQKETLYWQYADMGTPTPPLPYDAEVQYLENDGTQYINTGAYLDASNFEVGYEIYSSGFWWGFTHQGRANGTWIGLEENSGSASNTVFFGKFDNRFTASTSTENTIKFVSQSGATVNGTNYSKTFSLGTDSISSTPLYLFGRYDFANRIVDTNEGGFKLKSFYLKNNGTLVLDMIPVRKDGVGYMYDRVSGQLFGNAGTGSFIIGPDVQ